MPRNTSVTLIILISSLLTKSKKAVFSLSVKLSEPA